MVGMVVTRTGGGAEMVRVVVVVVSWSVGLVEEGGSG